MDLRFTFDTLATDESLLFQMIQPKVRLAPVTLPTTILYLRLIPLNSKKIEDMKQLLKHTANNKSLMFYKSIDTSLEWLLSKNMICICYFWLLSERKIFKFVKKWVYTRKICLEESPKSTVFGPFL